VMNDTSCVPEKQLQNECCLIYDNEWMS
jgi:hypothetical protein